MPDPNTTQLPCTCPYHKRGSKPEILATIEGGCLVIRKRVHGKNHQLILSKEKLTKILEYLNQNP